MKCRRESTRRSSSTMPLTATVRLIDDIQQNFHCCGAKGPINWKNYTEYPDGINLPVTCCNKDSLEDMSNCTTASSFHEGFVEIITDELKSSVNTFAY